MTTMLTLLGLWALLLSARGTPIGRLLDRGLIEMPARLIDRITRGHVLLALTLAAVVGAVFLILDYEGLRLMSMAAPEISSFLVMFEVSTWLDVAAAAVMAASALRMRGLTTQVRARIAGLRSRPRAPRSRASAETKPNASNDDDPMPALRGAA